MTWKWERRLPQLGGVVEVTAETFSTTVYFPGADRRHNGTFWKMTAGEIRQYAPALEEAWAQFEQFAATAPAGADLNARGKLGIGIHVAAWPGRGITLHSHNTLISSRVRLTNLIAELTALPVLAARVQSALREV